MDSQIVIKPFDILSINDSIWEIIATYIDRVSFMNLSRTCKQLYEIFMNITKDREEWLNVNLHNENLLYNYFKLGYRFIRINSMAKIYRVINFSHTVNRNISGKIYFSLIFYVISDEGLKIEMLGSYKKSKSDSKIKEVKVLVRSPTVYKLNSLKFIRNYIYDDSDED